MTSCEAVAGAAIACLVLATILIFLVRYETWARWTVYLAGGIGLATFIYLGERCR
jgi:hypothetical protein